MIRMTQKDRFSFILKKSRENQVLNLKDLADQLSVSTRTVRNDMTRLNQDLYPFAGMKIERGTIWLQINDEDQFKSYMTAHMKKAKPADTPMERSFTLTIRLLEADSPVKIDDLAERLHVGRTTLIDDLKRLRMTFESYGLQLKGKSNSGVYLSGSEWKKRIFILQNQISGYTENNRLVHQLIGDFAVRFHIEEGTQNAWSRYIQLMMMRTDSGHPLSTNDLPSGFQHVGHTKEFSKVSAFADKLEEVLHRKITKVERLFITLPILGRRSPVNIFDVTSIPIPESIRKLMDQIGRQIKDELNIAIDIDHSSHEFGYHLMFMINRLVFGVKLHNALIHEVKLKYPLAFEMAEIAYDVIYKNYHIRTNEAELGYLAYYFGIMISEMGSSLEHIHKAGIICDTGRSAARIIEVQLKKILNDHVKIFLYSANQVAVKALNQLDVVFSTVPVTQSIVPPVIHVTDIFNERALLKKINQVFELKELDVRTDEEHFSIIEHLLSKDKVFILDSQRSYQGNVKWMIHSLCKNSYVDDQFMERVVRREEKSQMVFENGIAFPHAVNRKNQLVFALGLSQEPIPFKDHSIRLIFLLAVPESSDENILIHIYDEMITFAKQPDLIYQLAHLKTFPDIRRFFNTVFQ